MDSQNPEKIFLSVVIPTYNEEARLRPGLKAICRYLAGKPFASEIIVVDDGSRDRTAEVAREALEGSIPFRVLRRANNLGKGYSVREGVLASTGEVVLFTDADLSTAIEEFDKFLPWLEWGEDVVICSRALSDSDIRVR